MKFTIIIFTTSLAIGVSALTFLSFNLQSDVVPEAPVVEIEAPTFEEPFLTVAIRSAERVEGDLQYLLSQSGLSYEDFTEDSADLDEIFEYMRAIEETKPIALMTWLGIEDPDDADFLFCFPVSDVERFTRMLKKHGQLNECALGWVYKSDDGTKKLVCHEGDYIYIAFNAGRLKTLPQNLEATLLSLVGDNSAAVKLDARKFPDEKKKEALDFVKNSPTAFLNLDDSQYMQAFDEWAVNFIQDTEELVLTLNIDQESKQIAIGSRLLAAEGSPTAQDSARNAALTSNRFADLRPESNSAMRFHVQSANLGDCIRGLQADAMRSIEASRTKEIVKSGEASLPDFTEPLEAMFNETLDAGNVEMAANAYFDGTELNSLIAIRFHDTQPLSDLIQTLRESENSPFNGTVAEEKGFRGIEQDGDLTMISFENKEDEDFFEGLPFDFSTFATFAFDKRAFYIVSGKKGPERLKNFIDATNTQTSSTCRSYFEIDLLPLWKTFMPQPLYSRFQSALKEGDSIAFECSPIENGFEANLTMDAAILSLGGMIAEIGKASEAQFQQISSDLETPKVRTKVKTRQPRKRTKTVAESTKADREFRKGFERGFENAIRVQNSGSGFRQNDETGSRISNPFMGQSGQ